MSTDEEYTSFLDKANQSTTGGGSKPSAQSHSTSSEKTAQADLPAELQNLQQGEKEDDGWWYTSEVDEPFEGWVGEWEGEGLPDEGAFASLLSHSPSHSEVEILSTKSWDPRGKYAGLVKTVARAASEKEDGVRVYRVGRGKTRAEYYVVAVRKGEDGAKGRGRVVGVRAKAVES